uniref:Cnd3 domain-containing protein n=1 Tax=Panagrellus redivivus TaxID=6233 RepID=A0A7E4ZRW7_PANRE
MEVLVDLLDDTAPMLQTEAFRTIQLVLEHEPEDMPRGPSLLDCGLLARIRSSIDAGSDHPGVIIAAFACAEAVLVESRGSALAKTIEAGLIEVALTAANNANPDSDTTQERLTALEFLLAAAQRVPKALKDHFAEEFVNNVANLCKPGPSEDAEVSKIAKKILRALEKKGVLTVEKLKELLPESGDCVSMGSTEVLDDKNNIDENETDKINEVSTKLASENDKNATNGEKQCDDGSDYENA